MTLRTSFLPKRGLLLGSLLAVAPAWGIQDPIPPTIVDDRPPSAQERRAWARARRDADSVEAEALKPLLSRSPTGRCGPDNWIGVDLRGVVCAHPDPAVLVDRRLSARIEEVLIPAAGLAGAGYAIVPPSEDAEGEGHLVRLGAGRVTRRTIFVMIEREQAAQARARVVSESLRSQAKALSGD
ncbi:MAG: hypothetical protein HY553_17805 [Elusimicrobia bacterium]|nr:hypothetical protein [Elusimicrobiota bacterium]